MPDRSDGAPADGSLDFLDLPPPDPASIPSQGSMADLERLALLVGGHAPRHFIAALGQFKLDLGRIPFDFEGDPFSEGYRGQVLGLLELISGRHGYVAARDEQASYLDAKPAGTPPAFYASGESGFVGEHLVAMGFILQQLDLKAGGSVLEYGAGEAQIALNLARMRCRVSIIDIEPRYFPPVLAQAEALGVRITCQHGEFGDGVADGQRFDRVLFYEAFHHALDHEAVLRRIHGLLAPGGRLVLACEPIIAAGGPWDRFVPFPWGPRLDGLSANAMRLHGWCELGFREDYFFELMLRCGFACRYVPCPLTAFGNCWIGTPYGDRLELGAAFTIMVSGRDAGWCEPDSGVRWTRGHALLPLDTSRGGGVLTVDVYNWLPLRRTAAFRVGGQETRATFEAGESRLVEVPMPAGSTLLEIVSDVSALAPYVGEHDTRVVGVAIRSVTYGPAVAVPAA